MILLRLFITALAAGLITNLAWGQNLVSNPGFDTDITGWSTGETATVQWDCIDADGNPASGSALVTNLSTTANDATGARQYITGITGGEYYKIFADTLIPSGQSATGRANLLVQWYDQANCTGQVGLFSTPWVTDSTPDVWLPTFGTALAPASAQCARLRLTVWKDQDSGTLDAHFDNVGFAKDQVFADSFEASLELGEPCDSGEECLTGFCAPQGICCDTACDGFNESCAGFETGMPDGMCGIIIN